MYLFSENLKTMISVQPLTYDKFVKAMGLPQFLINSGNKYNKEKRNTDLTGDAFLPYVKDIHVPTMVIQNSNDPMTNIMGLKKRSKVSAEFSMSSLTDIIFLLLIFFMLTSSLVRFDQFDLPTSDAQTMAPTNIVVTVAANGKYTVNGKPTPKRALN